MDNVIKQTGVGRSNVDKREAFFAAESFHRISQEIIPDNDREDDGYWFVPSVVNMAFACELYLKTIALDRTGEIKKYHNWLTIVNAIPGLIDELKELPRLASYEKLEQKIKESEGTFLEWRYPYENTHTKCVDIAFLEQFANALNDYISKHCFLG